MKNIFLILTIAFMASSCAVLHNVQIGEIESSTEMVSTPFEIKVSEFGVDLNDVKAISNAALSKGNAQRSNDALQAIQYFQMGPHTGAGVYSIAYVDHMERKIRQQCPSGRITGLMSIRESAEYPVIKGEIVKIKGYCLKTQKENL